MQKLFNRVMSGPTSQGEDPSTSSIWDQSNGVKREMVRHALQGEQTEGRHKLCLKRKVVGEKAG